LAGRAFFFELSPFSIMEEIKGGVAIDDLAEVVFRGGYPEVVAESLEVTPWYNAYISSYVERDVRQLIQLRDLSTFQRFLQMCAARTSQLWNRSSIGSDIGVTANTIDSWVSALEASHLITFLKPYHRNFGKRLTKAPKFYLNDSGLAARLLGIQSPEQCKTHPLWGSLVETWVLSQIRREYTNEGEQAPIWFWRDHRGTEVDVIIEQDNKAYPIEIKAGETMASDWLRPIELWNTWAKDAAGEATIIYGGAHKMTRSGGVRILPWNDFGFFR
jgi:predicted AAA+ superfamily ATPase